MDNEDELLDDRHFKDGVEFDELDADAENKLLGTSDDEDNVEYEYVDEYGKPVDIDENSGVEYEVVKDDETYQNQNEQDVLDLEVDRDLEFDDGTVSESTLPDNSAAPDRPESSNEQAEEDHYQYEEKSEKEDDNSKLSDSSESDDDEEAGRGRFRSERRNVVQLMTRKKRDNIPDSLDEVLKDDARMKNFRNQKQIRRDDGDLNQRYYERNKYRDSPSSRDRAPNTRGPPKSPSQTQDYGFSKEAAPAVQPSDNSWGNAQNSSTNVDVQSGTRKILINPHFKGAMPAATDVPRTNFWSNDRSQMPANYNDSYQQNVPPSSAAPFNHLSYGVPPSRPESAQGMAPVQSQMNMASPMRPPLLNPESLNQNDFHWNRNPFPAPAPSQHLPPSNILPPNAAGLIEPPPLVYPRERPPPLLPSDQYFNGNRLYQMRPMHPPNPPQWNPGPPRSNYDQFNAFEGMPNPDVWRPPHQTQNQPLLNNPPMAQLPKFPDIRQPPPSLQMQQTPRPLMNFSTPPPSFSNMRNDTSTNSWAGHRPPSVPNITMNNYPQMPPPLMGNQPGNIKSPLKATNMPFRLPLPTPNVPRLPNTKLSLLGTPVIMARQRAPNFAPRPQTNVGIVRQENPNWLRPPVAPQPAAGVYRKRGLEEKTGMPLKHQRTSVFLNQQGNVVRRKPVVVNANIKEVKIVDNLAAVEDANVKAPSLEKPAADDEDEETKKYRAQIELLNQKRAEILRIKEERREIMARQRRKLWLEQQKNLPENASNVEEQNVPIRDVNLISKPNVVVVQETPATPVVLSPTVKKRVVVLRRVVAAPHSPRKPVVSLNAQRTVESAASSISTVGSVLPERLVIENAGSAKATVKQNVRSVNRIVSVEGTAAAKVSVEVKPAPIRQLRTVLLDGKEHVNPPALKLNPPQVKSGQENIRTTRVVVQTGLNENLGGTASTADTQPGQRLKVLNSTANSNQTTVLIENLSLATTENNLRQLCQFYGPVEKIVMKKETRTALVKFTQTQHAKLFTDRCQRRMVDLSLITVSVLNS